HDQIDIFRVIAEAAHFRLCVLDPGEAGETLFECHTETDRAGRGDSESDVFEDVADFAHAGLEFGGRAAGRVESGHALFRVAGDADGENSGVTCHVARPPVLVLRLRASSQLRLRALRAAPRSTSNRECGCGV